MPPAFVLSQDQTLQTIIWYILRCVLMSDKFICAFFYFFRIHLCLKESSKPYSFKSFASLSGQVRAIRTIQFFKEHQKFFTSEFFMFFSLRSSPFNGQRVLNIAYFFNLSSEVWFFFKLFSGSSFLLMIITEAWQEFNIAYFFVLSNAIWNFFSFFFENLSQIIRQKFFRISHGV